MNPQVRQFHEAAANALGKLSKLVLPCAKLTLLVRRPEAPDGSQDMLVTDDDIESVIAALRIRQSEERAQKGAK